MVGALVVREVPLLGSQVDHVLDFADQGSLPLLALITLVNGIAEELFFRGAAYAATTRHPVVVTTVAYTLATLATGNVMLSFAAVLLGHVVGPAAPRVRRDPGADPDPLHVVADDALRAAAGVRLSGGRARLRLASARRTDSS